jgi:polysaccharide pyruvyl transferase WcaK-like protein
VLQRVAVIGVRDSESKAELASMGVTVPPVHVTADAVLSMHPVDKRIGYYLLGKAGNTGIGTRVGIAVRDWQGMTEYKDAIARAADELQRTTDCHVVFIPMQYPADVETGRDIASRMATRATVLTNRYSTVEFMSLMGCMDAVIANRLHALIFASIMKVPITALSYDPKIDSFVRLIGEKLVGTVESVTAEDIVADVKKKLALGRISPEVDAHMNHLRRQSLRNAYLALRVLEGRAGLRKRYTESKTGQD